MITIIKDEDLFNHIKEYDAILIGTNTYCTMSQGLQLKVMLNYPYVYDNNLSTKYGDIRKLGTIVDCVQDGEPNFCLCFISHGYNFRPDIQKDYLSYEALEKCLNLINIRYKGQNIASTLMGVSPFEGNGDKDKVAELFEKCLQDVNATVYDYRQLSRAEEMKKVYKQEQKLKRTDKVAYYEAVAKRKAEAETRFKRNRHRRY